MNNKMKYIMRSSLVCLWFICSCNKSPTTLPLTDDNAKNKEIVIAFIPLGTLVSIAKTKMEHEGFSCKIMSDEKIRDLKDTVRRGNSSAVDFLWCDRKAGLIIPRRWQVIMSLDSEDKVESVSVSTGLSGS